jgi:hypothetical protein
MSLLSRSVGAIIARSIALAMKLHGGKKPVSIRPSQPAPYGWRHIRCRQLKGWIQRLGPEPKESKRNRSVSSGIQNYESKPISSIPQN